MLRLKIIFAVLPVFVLLAPDIFSAGSNEAAAPLRKSYRSRLLGDEAFNDGAYEEAIAFYSRYKKEAAKDYGALNNAYKCLISSYIRAGEPVKAARQLKEYESKFPDSSKTENEFFKADIYLLLGKYEEAGDIFKRLSNALSTSSPFYLQALSGLGFSLLQREKWKSAVTVFLLLEKEAKGTKWEFVAIKGRIYSLIMDGKTGDAETILKAVPKPASKREVQDLNVLRVLLAAKQGRFKEMRQEFNKVKTAINGEPQPLLYQADMTIASMFLTQSDPDEAMGYLKDAFIHAPSPLERRKALRMIINVYVLLDKKRLAVSAARRYMHYYGNAEDACNVVLQAARLSYELNDVNEAVKLYDGIISDSSISFDVRLEAAGELIGIFVEDKDFVSADKRLKTLFAAAGAQKEKGECEFLSAKLFYDQKEYQEAAKAFSLVADKHKELRPDSLYWEMRSLLGLKDFEKALKVSENAIKEFAGSDTEKKCLYFHALILEKLGRKNEAEREYLDFASKNPKSDYAPMSLFGAANIALADKKYSEAGKMFSSLAETYPANPLAPNALYKKYYCEYFQGNENEAVENAKKLIDRYPKSRFSSSALFWLVDYFRELKDYEKAVSFLDELISKFRDDKEISAQALYEKAYVFSKAEKPNRALDCLKELNQKYPDNKVASDGLFLCGDIYSAKGDYAEAITYYQKAAERRPGSALETASIGRIGDCEFSLYTKTFNKEYLHKSVKEYEKVLERKDISPFIKNQCLYKMGKCFELLGYDNMALTKYRELIYGYRIDKARGREVSPVWTVKAGHSAISLYLKEGSPEAVKSAMEIYKVLIKLNVDLADDYKKLLEKLKEKYNI